MGDITEQWQRGYDESTGMKKLFIEALLEAIETGKQEERARCEKIALSQRLDEKSSLDIQHGFLFAASVIRQAILSTGEEVSK